MKIEKRITLLIIIFVMAFFTGSYTGAQDNAKWQEALLKERLEKDESFKKFPDSHLARSKRLVIPASPTETFLVETENDVLLSDKQVPGAQLTVLNKQGQWYWYSHAVGITCTAGDKSIESGAPLTPDASIKLGRCILKVFPAAERLLLMVYDPERPQFKHFSHLLYFQPDPQYAVKAVVEKFPTVEPFKVRTSQKEEKTYYRYARLKFQIEGKELQLTAFKFNLDEKDPEYNTMFIPFCDATSGKETYEVGRFLDVREPRGKEGAVILDFNRCYNPLCNYSPGFNCPIPPLENYLDIPIKAGEKTYPH
jgi:uncharacterized protein (DUF1684 family)